MTDRSTREPVTAAERCAADVATWDVDDDGNWMSEWDGATVRELVRIVQQLRRDRAAIEQESAARALAEARERVERLPTHPFMGSEEVHLADVLAALEAR